MDDHVRSELTDLLKTGGRSICATPRMVGILLRERCLNAEKSVCEIEQALTIGCVREMLEAIGPVDGDGLAERLVNESGMSRERAVWVIESWAQAIAAADIPEPLARDWSAWNRLDVSAATAGGGGPYQRAVGHLIIVGIAGAVGGAGLGLEVLLRGGAARPGPWRDALEDLPAGLHIAALLVLGMLGGFAGGLTGWISAGGRSWTYDALGGTTLGRLGIGALGALSGAGIGAMAGISLLGLIGVMLGALFGALFGAILGLFLAEGISRLLP